MYELFNMPDNLSVETTARTASKSSNTAHLPYMLSLYVKNYIYNLYAGKIKDDDVRVERFCGIISQETPFIDNPVKIFDENTGLYYFSDSYLFSTIRYKEESYEITIKSIRENSFDTSPESEIHGLWINGASQYSEKAADLSDRIIEGAIKNSVLKNKILLYTQDDSERDFLRSLSEVSPSRTKLEDLYIPASKNEQIERYIFAIGNYHKSHLSLRYLLNGKPGTGKTQLINSVINETKGKITVLICNGGRVPVKDVFSFCQCFEPCLLVMDDFDFIAGERNENLNKPLLSNLLQQFDGFLPNNVFVLASTNDKKLVDAAASRPGRFDLILDIGEISPENYLALIKRETSDEEILSLFNMNVLREFHNNKVTGAFIVSFIKQLHSAKEMKGNITKEDFAEYFKFTHSGFYNYNDFTFLNNYGFRNN